MGSMVHGMFPMKFHRKLHRKIALPGFCTLKMCGEVVVFFIRRGGWSFSLFLRGRVQSNKSGVAVSAGCKKGKVFHELQEGDPSNHYPFFPSKGMGLKFFPWANSGLALFTGSKREVFHEL